MPNPTSPAPDAPATPSPETTMQGSEARFEFGPDEQRVTGRGFRDYARIYGDAHDPYAPEAAMDPAPPPRRRGARTTTRTVTPIETAPASKDDALPWEQ